MYRSTPTRCLARACGTGYSWLAISKRTDVNRESGIGNRESGIGNRRSVSEVCRFAVADLACEVQSPSLKKATEAQTSAAAQRVISCADPTAQTPDLPGRCNWPRGE
ncbi:hypothetical protein FQJ90_11245 [Xanthomonas vasicola]|nr:hypothetical protein FQJ94_04375 [Xanthomonas vasicola]TWQ63954.1 hypothetical protein FQJ90_11245 [Xanthomonas vasicola]TWR09381.1 hypothetical protein FQJ85_10265 [Xanthomonas vasicola]